MKSPKSFHESLASFFNEKVKDLKQDDAQSTDQVFTLEKQVKSFSQDHFQNKSAFFEMVDIYQKVENESDKKLEQILLKEISNESFLKLGIPEYAWPKIYRGMPRFYDKQNIAKAFIKPHFRSLPHLRYQYVDKALHTLFEDVDVIESKVVLFTYVMPGGLGDFASQISLAELLKKNFPSLKVQLVTLVDENTAFFSPKSTIPITKVIFSSKAKQYPSVDDFPRLALKKLRDASLIIQVPTYYPETEKLLEKLKDVPSDNSFPEYELIGEYGFVEANAFHPQTNARCMGLHFLEKGIITKDSIEASFVAIKKLKDKSILEQLFSTKKPTEKVLSEFQKKHRLFFAYLVTDEGHYLYLHALLKMLYNDRKTVHVVVSDIRQFLHNIETRFKEDDSYPLFERFGVKKILMHYREDVFALDVSPVGKDVHFHCMENLSSKDFSVLCQVSEDFVGCRGDGSFTEAVSANKLYFYDGLDHAKNFLKDLLALAENQVANFHVTIQYIRFFLDQIKLDVKDTDPWVDELFFQKEEEKTLYERGEALGRLLQNPALVAGMRRLNEVLQKSFSFNQTFLQLVKRKLIHHHHPAFGIEEKALIALFSAGDLTFKKLILSMRKQIRSLKKSQKSTEI